MRFDTLASLCPVTQSYKYSSFLHLATIWFAVTMEKRCRPPPGYYKSLETAVLSRDRKKSSKRPDVLGIYQAERIVGKKIFNGKPMFMVKWKNFWACENTREPKAYLPSELIEAFENPEPDPVRVEEARERIGLVLKGEWKFHFKTKSRSRFATTWSVSCSRSYQHNFS